VLIYKGLKKQSLEVHDAVMDLEDALLRLFCVLHFQQKSNSVDAFSTRTKLE
jgi:hypothetical protein